MAFSKQARTALVGLVLLLSWPLAGWPDFHAALAAYQRGDYTTAFREFRVLAEQGDASAQVNVGFMYHYGHGVPQDYAQAVRWYRQAAQQGDAVAQFNLGLSYEIGEGLTQDYDEAAKWYLKAAEQGDNSAQLNLGLMYINGQGVPQNYAEAATWLSKAAEQGDVRAQGNLGFMYGEGQGVPQDYVQAYAWFNVAATVGNEIAVKNRDILTERMTPSQLEAGQKLAMELFERCPSKSEPPSENQPSRSSLVHFIQQQLLALGYAPSPPDGIIDLKTRDAIRRFQQDHSLLVNGEVTNALLEYLKGVGS